MKKVLLVDDDESVHIILGAYLEGPKAILFWAKDLEGGWELFQEERHGQEWDLVIVRASLRPDALHLAQLIRNTGYDGHMMVKSALPESRERFTKSGLCDCETDGAGILPNIRKVFGWPEP